MSINFFMLHFALVIHLLIILSADICGNRIYHDITKLANDHTKTIANITSAVKSFSTYFTFHKKVEPNFIYYEYDFDFDDRKVKSALHRISSTGLDIQLLINLKDWVYPSDEKDLKHVINTRYSGLLNILSDQLTIVNNLSFEMHYVKNMCNYNRNNTQMNQRSTSVIREVQEFLRLKNKRKLEIGYVFDYRHLNCLHHLKYKNDADFFIVDYPLMRNDKLFVESYGAFKDNMQKQKSVLIDNFYDINQNKSIFYKLSMDANLEVDDAKDKECPGKGILQSRGKELVDMATKTLDGMQMDYMDKYENVFKQFCRELLTEEEDLMFILKYKSVSNIDNVPSSQYMNGNLVIPELPKLDVKVVSSFDFLLEEIAASGFDTIMLKAGTWQELIRKGLPDPNCINELCRPRNVLYFNDIHNSFSEPALYKNGIQNLLQIGGMNLRGLIFSKYYKESRSFNWSDGVERLRLKAKSNRENAATIETGCTEWIDIFGYILNMGKYDTICDALELQRVLGCGSLSDKSNIVVWRGDLKLKSNDINNFIENTIKKLDALLLGRQILRIRHGADKNVYLRIKVTYEDKQSPIITQPIYCTTWIEDIYRLYEILLTWAKIHDFPIILQPSSSLVAYDNPISWQQLQTTVPGQVRDLMGLFPIFIRRNYNHSKVFASWTKGMYVCIAKSKDKKAVEGLSFQNQYVGTTISLNLRSDTNRLNSRELETILLFALLKFVTVEVILRSRSELNVLYNTISRNNFKDTLKINNISQRNIYLSLPASLSNDDSGRTIPLVFLLNACGFNVKIHYLASDEFRNGYDVFVNHSNISVGIVLENCTDNANEILTSNFFNNINISRLDYLICDTNLTPADNNDDVTMQDLLNSHLYLKKLFKYFFPNLKEIHFRLHPILYGNTSHKQTQNLLLFLADINNYANTHDIHYFLLPALSPQIKKNEASFWTSKNYQNLRNVFEFEEIQSKFLNMTNWVPKLVKDTEDNMIQTSTVKATTGNPNSPSFSKMTKIPTTSLSSMASAPITFSFSPKDVDESTSDLFEQHIRNATTNEALPNVLWLSYYQYILIGVASFAFLVILLVTSKILKSYKYLTEKEVTDFFNGRRETLEEASVKRKRDTTHSFNIFDGLVYQRDHEISKNTIKLNTKSCISLEGHFSKIYKGKMPESDEQILVEICNKRISKSYFISLLSEVKMLCYLENHFNIVRFIGCYTKEIRKGILWIATEFCEVGSLEAYISKFKDNIRLHEMVKFAKEIASGMDYLSIQDVIHGDLRTKYVYLNEPNKICKIGKFGLSRKLLRYQELVEKGKHDLLPWRWMSLESLEKLEFSSHSDVWSFGVTIWEIFTLGNTPYEDIMAFKDIEMTKFKDQLKDGRKLSCPTLVTSEIYQIMVQSWTLEPKCRPNFTNLEKFFSDQLLQVNKDK